MLKCTDGLQSLDLHNCLWWWEPVFLVGGSSNSHIAGVDNALPCPTLPQLPKCFTAAPRGGAVNYQVLCRVLGGETLAYFADQVTGRLAARSGGIRANLSRRV